MAQQFPCTQCGEPVIIRFLQPGETAACKSCGREQPVPGDAEELDAEAARKALEEADPAITVACPTCGEPTTPGDNFCPECGHSLSSNPYAAPAEILPAASVGPGVVPQGEEVPNYLVPSILATLFCCTLFGIIAIIYSAMANGKKIADPEGARANAETARNWLIASVASSLVIGVIYLLVILADM